MFQLFSELTWKDHSKTASVASTARTKCCLVVPPHTELSSLAMSKTV